MLRSLPNHILNFIFIFTIFCVALSGSSKRWESRLENRNPALFPSYESVTNSWPRFTKEFESYFSDRIGFRKEILKVRSWIYLNLFTKSASSKVLLGKDDWLYYATDKSLENLTGELRLGQSDFENWRQTLLRRQRFAKDHGINYVFVLAPNKQTIYPEYLPPRIQPLQPSNADRLMGFLAESEPEFSLVDLRKRLVLAKQDSIQLFHRLDIHWTDYGAYVGYRTILDAIKMLSGFSQARTVNFGPSGFRTTQTNYGDLAGMMGFLVYPKWTETIVANSKGLCTGFPIKDEPQDANDSWAESDYTTDCPNALNEKRLLIFRDSMIYAMQDYLASTFKHVRYISIWPYSDFRAFEHFVEIEKPDVVVEEIIERNLVAVPDPDSTL